MKPGSRARTTGHPGLRALALLGLTLALCHCGPVAEPRDKLHAAVRGHDLEALRALAGDPARGIDEPGDQGRTALQLAAELGRGEALGILLAGGADPNAPGPNGRSALHLAARRGHFALATPLLAAGAAADSVSPDGWSVLHAAAQGGRSDWIELLLARGADPWARTAGAPGLPGKTPLYIAIQYGQGEAVGALLDAT
ncbi:MAG: ankyrin repeat domain-containing protein, partial [Myxococcota bacterium]|nr:ankyrin repeat domain-containing protein [Myxococcota bacterium]